MSKNNLSRCTYCGRSNEKGCRLTRLRSGYLCDECNNLWTILYGSSNHGQIQHEQWERDAAVFDEYKRYEVEIANQSTLRSQYKAPVADPKNPAEKERLRAISSNELNTGLMAHPLLHDKVQFSGINEENSLPTMDPEQAEKYYELQLELQNQKRLERLNEAMMSPTQP